MSMSKELFHLFILKYVDRLTKGIRTANVSLVSILLIFALYHSSRLLIMWCDVILAIKSSFTGTNLVSQSFFTHISSQTPINASPVNGWKHMIYIAVTNKHLVNGF